MDTILSARPGLRARALGAGFAGLLTLTSAASALAQDAEDFAFPATLAGQELEVETFTGPEYLEQFSGGEAEDTTFIEDTQALVEGVGATIDDLTVKSALYQPAEGVPAVVAGFRIADVEAVRFARDAVGLLLGDLVEPGLLLRPVAGKWVLRVVDESMPGVYPRTVFLKDDTAWIIEGDEEFVWDALDQLPDLAAPAVSAGDQIVDQIPMELDGRRRTGLYEATEPLFLPTISERLDDNLERWLVDLYLEDGLTPADMIGLVTWWGIESSQESVQIEGYQLAGADESLIERLRSEILLADGTELPEGVTRSEQEIGGKQVTTVDFGSGAETEELGFPAPRQHIYSSGDTVWVVTDHVGEPELAAAALEALP